MKITIFTIIQIVFVCNIIKNVSSLGQSESMQSYIMENINQLTTVSHIDNEISTEIMTDSYTSFREIFKNIVGITEPTCLLAVFYDEKDGNFDWIDSILSLKHPTTVSQ